MTKIKTVTGFLENIAPLELQESYDNSGLLVGDDEKEVKGVLCALDATPDIIQEAVDKGLNLVIAHHPIIFSGLKKLTGRNYIEKAVLKAIKNDIAIYAIHTNLDNILNDGVNGKIAQKLGLQSIEILRPHADNPQLGSGVIGQLVRELPPNEFLKYLKNSFELSVFKFTDFRPDSNIRTVAACGGSGSFLLQDAIDAGADVFITSDWKYHQFFDAENKITIIDIGHYESEKYTIQLLNDLINNNFRNFAAHCTERNTNPVNYYF